jgi:hypothetical protein
MHSGTSWHEFIHIGPFEKAPINMAVDEKNAECQPATEEELLSRLDEVPGIADRPGDVRLFAGRGPAANRPGPE